MKVLIIDDHNFRHESISKKYIGDDIDHAYKFADACQLLSTTKYDIVQLDHDLGDFTGENGRDLTGYDIMLYLVKFVDIEIWPTYIVIHTGNNVGAYNIKQLLTNYGISCIIEPFRG